MPGEPDRIEMNKEVVEIINDLSLWLNFQKQLGVDTIPKGPGLSAFLDLGTGHGESPVPNTLDEVRRLLGDCNRCELHRERHNIVFGEGPQDAKLILVGEAPGREEDLRGRPFIGASGELLTKMLSAVKISREEVYITNVVKCRPPNNRMPKTEEMAICSRFLNGQLAIIDPPLILALGLVAAQALLKVKSSLRSLRGRFHKLGNAKVMVIYHPSYLLRAGGSQQEALKREAWHDLQLLEKEYEKYR